jgi:hypothetical protein
VQASALTPFRCALSRRCPTLWRRATRPRHPPPHPLRAVGSAGCCTRRGVRDAAGRAKARAVGAANEGAQGAAGAFGVERRVCDAAVFWVDPDRYARRMGKRALGSVHRLASGIRCGRPFPAAPPPGALPLPARHHVAVVTVHVPETLALPPASLPTVGHLAVAPGSLSAELLACPSVVILTLLGTGFPRDRARR